MGHDSERAAIIYQHEARGADLAITSAIDAHIETAKASQGQPGDGSPEAQLKSGNGPLMAHGDQQDAERARDAMSGVPADLGVSSGAGDGNRTRTISLGS